MILAAAIELVDRDGLDALTMRRLAERLGVEAMSLYGYVRNKADLLDGIHDALLGQMTPTLDGGDPTEDIRRIARAFREVLRAHPNALPIFATRPARGESSLRQVELGLSVLERMGMPPARALATFQVLFAFVVGHALYTFGKAADADEVDYASLPDALAHVRSLPAVLQARDLDAEFELGLETFIAGMQVDRTVPARPAAPRRPRRRGG